MVKTIIDSNLSAKKGEISLILSQIKEYSEPEYVVNRLPNPVMRKIVDFKGDFVELDKHWRMIEKGFPGSDEDPYKKIAVSVLSADSYAFDKIKSLVARLEFILKDVYQGAGLANKSSFGNDLFEDLPEIEIDDAESEPVSEVEETPAETDDDENETEEDAEDVPDLPN